LVDQAMAPLTMRRCRAAMGNRSRAVRTICGTTGAVQYNTCFSARF
jgi:hypothetical protein